MSHPASAILEATKKGALMPVPGTVRYAMFAVYAVVALVVLRVILTVVLKDDLVDKWIEGHATARALPREEAIRLFTPPAFVPVAIIALVIAGLLALAAFNLSKGAGWARIVVIVFAVLQVISVALSFAAPSLPVLLVVNVLVALLCVAVIVLLFTADAKQFFASRKATAAA
jgi:hypothetical protein